MNPGAGKLHPQFYTGAFSRDELRYLMSNPEFLSAMERMTNSVRDCEEIVGIGQTLLESSGNTRRTKKISLNTKPRGNLTPPSRQSPGR